MFVHVDLAGPFEDPLVGALQLLEDPAVVLRLLEVGEGDAGCEVDLVHQWLNSICSYYTLGGQSSLALST